MNRVDAAIEMNICDGILQEAMRWRTAGMMMFIGVWGRWLGCLLLGMAEAGLFAPRSELSLMCCNQ